MVNTTNKKPFSIGMGTIVGGLISLVFLVFSADTLLNKGNVLGAVAYLIPALLAAPYLWDVVQDKYKLKISLPLRIILIPVVAFIAMLIAAK